MHWLQARVKLSPRVRVGVDKLTWEGKYNNTSSNMLFHGKFAAVFVRPCAGGFTVPPGTCPHMPLHVLAQEHYKPEL